MYVHPAFHADADMALAMLGARGFGLLAVADARGLPQGVHIPFLAAPTAEGLRIELHVARSNGIHALLEAGGRPALLAVSGPDAYLSPDWYGVPAQVPTWTYTAVHLSGVARLMPAEALPGHLARLSEAFEARLAPKAPWRMEGMEPPRLQAMMRAIVGIEVLVPREGIQAQRKLIQHKPEAAQRGVIAALAAQPDPAAREVAALMAAGLAARAG